MECEALAALDVECRDAEMALTLVLGALADGLQIARIGV
ncbi:hypothetical protein AKJ09_03515 [Labilithrix luteola]|uniref:Uncharacterized protein n=1 Tax=Labilithrix luteola TaxID=1391654 RepID=A0A0K1PU13_9BACT|nr:hypothetical protein AKJ09_03515 [Labilithrix luteola]